MPEENRPLSTANGHPPTNGSAPAPAGTQAVTERRPVGLFEPPQQREVPVELPDVSDTAPVESQHRGPLPGLPRPHDGLAYGAAAAAAPRGRTIGGLVVAVVAGVLVGGTLGGVYSGTTAGGAEASALVEVYASDNAVLPGSDGGGGSSADEIANFAANEFVALSGEAFKADVADVVGDPDAPGITVTRVGQSTVANFTAKGATDAEGLAVVQTAVDLYTERRATALADYARRTVDGIDRTVRELQDPGRPIGLEVQQRVDRLLAQRADLELLLNSGATPARVVGPPSSAAPDDSPWLLGAVLGALLGGLAAVGATVLRRMKTSLILDTPSAEAVVSPILHPVLALPADWQQETLTVSSAGDRYAARLLAGQVAGSRPLAGRAVGVVGASARSGARAVATLLAAGAAELTATELVEFAALPHPLLPADSDVDNGVCAEPTLRPGLNLTQSDEPASALGPGDPQWAHIHEVLRRRDRFVVIDAGTRPEVLRQLPGTVEMLLVVGLGADDARHVAALARSLPSDVAPRAVATRMPWYLRLPGVSRLRSHA